jgi:hypothetical protein
MNPFSTLTAMTVLLCLTACGGENTGSNVRSPGAEESAKTQVLEAGAALLQDKPPIAALNAYLDGFHFYNGNMQAQMEAHHYCANLNEELIQCVIYDGNKKEARLMGVEYIVSARLFTTLPEAEKAMWHTHVHEVKSGQLIAPGIPEVAEHALMEKLVGTYGKTFHTWHTDMQRELPVGVPQIMMGFTGDKQIDPRLVTARDSRFGISSEKKKEERADIESPATLPGPDAWQMGQVVQIADPTAPESARAALGGH